jgi:hypothetical protein
MFEFQGNRNDPVKLLTILERFTNWWFGDSNGEYGVAEERLSKVSLPTPLRRLYGFAGEWPGGIFESIFSHQDHLVPFECLSVRDGKLIFVFENQGVWKCGTEQEGDDPPVWISIDGDAWNFLCDSLAQFLVTFCLHESIYGAPVSSAINNIQEILQSSQKFEVPLWLDGPYPSCNGVDKLSFHIIEGRILRMNEMLGARCKGNEESYPEFFPPESRRQPPRYSGLPIWEIPDIPYVFKKNNLKMLVSKHEQLADYHKKKEAFYRDVLEKIK